LYAIIYAIGFFHTYLGIFSSEKGFFYSIKKAKKN